MWADFHIKTYELLFLCISVIFSENQLYIKRKNILFNFELNFSLHRE